MLFFGGSKYETWENLLGDLKEEPFVQDIFENLKDIRELLYDFSIAIFNQWKGHKNILDFDVTVSGSDINIEVIYNFSYFWITSGPKNAPFYPKSGSFYHNLGSNWL